MRYLAALTAIMIAPAALAADKGAPKPATLEQIMALPADRAFSCYAGAMGGFGIATTTLKDETSRAPLGATGTQGSILGGCDVKSNGYVIGIWGDYTAGDLKARIKDGTDTADLALARQWAIGGRLGYHVQPSTMIFIGAGYAEATAEAKSEGMEASAKISGIAGLAGIETKIADPIWFRFDAVKTFYDTDKVQGTKIEATSTAVRAGIVVRF